MKSVRTSALSANALGSGLDMIPAFIAKIISPKVGRSALQLWVYRVRFHLVVRGGDLRSGRRRLGRRCEPIRQNGRVGIDRRVRTDVAIPGSPARPRRGRGAHRPRASSPVSVMSGNRSAKFRPLRSVRRWYSRQWHKEMRDGSPSIESFRRLRQRGRRSLRWSAVGHAAKAGTNTSGAGGLYPTSGVTL